ncbi:MAG: RluA family pseudouridine synthase [Oscillospiraceae bacterium]|nr:RluA family pseudouridine synthase [Oscillospiraceae bacterium]
MKKEIVIGENDAGQRLDRFLLKLFPALKSGIINKAVRGKDIKLNGKRTEISCRLAKNDTVYIFLPDSLLETKKDEDNFMAAKDDLTVIYEDENILLADKEQGLVVHCDESGTADTLINRIKKYLFLKGEYFPENEQSFTPSLCNRIDKNTGGIVIAAKNAESLRILNEKIKNRELTKKYLCIVIGKPNKNEDLLTAFLERDMTLKQVRISDKKTPDNLTVKTKYKVMDSCGELSLLEVELLTGRTHQIRAHMAYIGHPLLGDGKYGINRINTKYGFKMQALYSYKLKFDFAGDSGILNYLNKKEYTVKNVPFIAKYEQIKENVIRKDKRK